MYDDAKAALEDSIVSASKCGAQYYLAFAYRMLGEVSRKTKADKSYGYFDKSIELSKDIKAENELALAYAGYGRLYKQQGNAEKAMEYLNKAKNILDRLGTLVEPEKIKKELEELR
jgi:tetratricopeptide (TPR) repeat protein